MAVAVNSRRETNFRYMDKGGGRGVLPLPVLTRRNGLLLVHEMHISGGAMRPSISLQILLTTFWMLNVSLAANIQLQWL
jgi:hypothetical protein